MAAELYYIAIYYIALCFGVTWLTSQANYMHKCGALLWQIADLVEPLQRLDVFARLNPGDILEIIKHSERVIFRPGSVIIEENQNGAAAYFIVVGLVERLPQPEYNRSREHFGHGVLVGEMAMLTEHVHTSTVRAKSEVRALKISRDMMYQIMAERPQMAETFIETIRLRLSSMAENIRYVDKTLAAVETVTFDEMVKSG